MVGHWEYGIGILVWLNILCWLVYGAWQERRRTPEQVEDDLNTE